MNVTIKDIAKDTGLSLATISKYINGKNVLPENSSLIEKSIKKLGYVPNKSAQALRSGKSNAIAVILPFFGDYFWASVTSHIEEEFRKTKYSTLVISRQCDLTHDIAMLKDLISKNVDGVIIIPFNDADLELTKFITGKIPFIILDLSLDQYPCDCVISANASGTYQAAQLLLTNKHRKIGLLAGVQNSYTTKERIRGTLKCLEENHQPPENLLISYGDYTADTAQKQFKDMMSAPSPPTAVIAMGYTLGIGAITQANSSDLHIPQDLSLIVFDDDIVFSSLYCPITVISQDKKEIAHQAVELLSRRINGDYTDFPCTKEVTTSLIIRDSVEKNTEC